MFSLFLGTERIPYGSTGYAKVDKKLDDGTTTTLTVSAYVGEHSDSIDKAGVYKRAMEFCIENTNYGHTVTLESQRKDLKYCALQVMRGIIASAFSWDADESLYSYSPPPEESEESGRDGDKNIEL